MLTSKCISEVADWVLSYAGDWQFLLKIMLDLPNVNFEA